MSSLSGQVMSPQSLFNCCLPPPCYFVTLIRKALSNMKAASWPIWHHNEHVEGCWWGRRWTSKATGGGCFQQQWEPSRLGGSFTLKGKGWGPRPWQISQSQLSSSQTMSWSCWNGCLCIYIGKMVNIAEMQFIFIFGQRLWWCLSSCASYVSRTHDVIDDITRSQSRSNLKL